MTIKDFNDRVEYNGGVDRKLNGWEILDIHQIPKYFLEDQEIDFYCFNGDQVYLLRLRNKAQEKYTIIKKQFRFPEYLMAELPLNTISNDYIEEILQKFVP